MKPYLVALAFLYKNKISASAAVVFSNNSDQDAILAQITPLMHPDYQLVDVQIGLLQQDVITKFNELSKPNVVDYQ